MSRLSPAAKEGISRLTNSLSRSKAAEVMERAERAAGSAVALAELERDAAAASDHLVLAVAGALRDEIDGKERDPWGVEDAEAVDRRSFQDVIAEREARGDSEGAAALRGDLEAFDAEERARAEAAVAAERAEAAAAADAAAERAEMAQLFGGRK